MRGAGEYAQLIAARVLSGGAGYIVLALAANRLQPGTFATLAFYQTLQFLTTTIIDTGMVQAGTRHAAGTPSWVWIGKEYQSIRALFHILASIPVFVLGSVGAHATVDPLLPLSCAFALGSNSLNGDWLLVARGLRTTWAQKAILVGVTNVICVTLGFALSDRPSTVLFGQAVANVTGAAFLWTRSLLPIGLPRLPSVIQFKEAMKLSSAAIAAHGAYNLPLLAVTSFAPAVLAGSFACMYRMFSASTLLVPVMSDFTAAKIISERRANHQTERSSEWAVVTLLITCVTAVIPFLLTPNSLLVVLFGAAINLSKYGISEGHFWVYKLALVLYCVDSATQRYAYVVSDHRALVLSATIGLLANAGYSAWLLHAQPGNALTWFYPLLLYQFSASAILLSIRRTRVRRFQKA